MALATTSEDKQFTEIAEQIYTDQKDEFVQSLAERIKKSVEIGMAQVENGQTMTLEESKRRIYEKFFKNSLLTETSNL